MDDAKPTSFWFFPWFLALFRTEKKVETCTKNVLVQSPLGTRNPFASHDALSYQILPRGQPRELARRFFDFCRLTLVDL